MKCCGNCEWSYTFEDEEDLKNESRMNNGGVVEEEDIFHHAGDCMLGKTHHLNYYCSSHSYRDGMEKTQLFYDERYLAPGFLFVTTVDDEIEKFLKISLQGEGGYPEILLRSYEKGEVDSCEESFRTINIPVSSEDPFFEAIYLLAEKTNAMPIYSIDSYEQGQNHVIFTRKPSIQVVKDVFGVRNATDFIDIRLGDENSCCSYSALWEFYQNLSCLPVSVTKEEDVKKLILL